MGQWAHVPQGSVPRRRRRCQREPLPEARLYACAPCRRGRLHGDTEGVRRNRSPEARLYSCAPCRRGRFLGDTEGVRENRSHRHVCTHALRAGGAGFPATPKVSKGTAPAGTFRIMRCGARSKSACRFIYAGTGALFHPHCSYRINLKQSRRS